MRITRSPALLVPAIATLLSVAAAGQTPASTLDAASLPLSTLSTALNTPQRQAAEDGLRTLTNRLIAATHAPHARHANRIMAVDDYHALRDAFIGSGFEVNLIDPDALLAGKGIKASTHGSGAWRFVVMLGNKPVGLITVARLQGQWQMVEAGASEMAREVMDVVSRYARVAPSAQLRFIRSSQGMADFIEVIQPAEADRAIPPLYVPLFSTQAALDDGGAVDANGANTAGTSAPAPALAEAEFASDLRASVRRGMRDPRFVH